MNAKLFVGWIVNLESTCFLSSANWLKIAEKRKPSFSKAKLEYSEVRIQIQAPELQWKKNGSHLIQPI